MMHGSDIDDGKYYKQYKNVLINQCNIYTSLDDKINDNMHYFMPDYVKQNDGGNIDNDMFREMTNNFNGNVGIVLSLMSTGIGLLLIEGMYVQHCYEGIQNVVSWISPFVAEHR